MTKTFDPLIKQATLLHMPGNDWRLIKAQLIAESNLDEHAKSEAGALGIAQFMKDTWKQIAAEMDFPATASREQAQYAIPACCFYMRTIWDQWTAQREDLDRYCLTLASYNAGIGNILKAQQAANGANDYASIIRKLPGITGLENAKQTTDYVRRIIDTWAGMAMDYKKL